MVVYELRVSSAPKQMGTDFICSYEKGRCPSCCISSNPPLTSSSPSSLLIQCMLGWRESCHRSCIIWHCPTTYGKHSRESSVSLSIEKGICFQGCFLPGGGGTVEFSVSFNHHRLSLSISYFHTPQVRMFLCDLCNSSQLHQS